MVSAMMVAEQAGVRMMKEYFEIEASKATPQYGFRKGLTLFGDGGYQAAKHEPIRAYKDTVGELDSSLVMYSCWGLPSAHPLPFISHYVYA